MTEKLALPPELRPWREHVCACQASGQTMVAYAKSHRLSVPPGECRTVPSLNDPLDDAPTVGEIGTIN